jgi:hypothetical protein
MSSHLKNKLKPQKEWEPWGPKFKFQYCQKKKKKGRKKKGNPLRRNKSFLTENQG